MNSRFAKLSLSFLLFYYLLVPYPGFSSDVVLLSIRAFGAIIPYIIAVLILAKYENLYIPMTKELIVFLTLFFFVILSSFASFFSFLSITVFEDIVMFAGFLGCFIAGLLVSSLVASSVVKSILGVIFVINIFFVFIVLLPGFEFVRYLYSGRNMELIDLEFSFRAIGTLGNPNFFAVFVSSVSAYFLFDLGASKKFDFVRVIAASGGAVLLLLSQSRTILFGYVFLIVSLLLLNIVTRRKSRVYFSAKLICLLVVFIIGALYVGFDSLSYLTSGINTVLDSGLAEQNSFKTRLFIWGEYLRSFYERPIVGHGKYFEGLSFPFSDNNYVFFLYKYGVISFVLVVAFFLRLFASALSNYFLHEDAMSLFFICIFILIAIGSLTGEVFESFRLGSILFIVAGLISGRNVRGFV